MKDKALLTISEYNMFERGDKLLAAFSGGADSVALLVFLCSLREEWGISVGALHLNHRLRGDESEADEAFVRAFCEEIKAPLMVESADVRAIARREGEGIEACGRRLRYSFFAREAKRQGAKIAVAHTRGDSAETMLLNLARGTGARGLCGVPPVRGEIIRPLIDCSREDVERYCAENGFPYITDSTNLSDDYARNRVRRHVIPLLLAENPRFLDHMAETARMLRDDADYLDGQAIKAMESLILPGGGIGRAGFLDLPKALRGRILLELTRRSGLEAGRLTLEGLSGIIESGSGRRQLSRHIMFRCDGKKFYFETIKSKQPFFSAQVLLKETGEGKFYEVYLGKWVKINIVDYKTFKEINYFRKKDLTYCLDCDRIDDVITLRQKLPGDKLRLPGRGCTKTLKNLFQESGTPAEQRLRRVVAADRGGTLWVEGAGADERAGITGKTKRVVIFEVTEDAAWCGIF